MIKYTGHVVVAAVFVAGTDPGGSELLRVAGAAKITGALAVTGNVAVNTNKFTVDAATGNTTIAGTVTLANGQFYSAKRTSGGLTIPLLGITSGTDTIVLGHAASLPNINIASGGVSVGTDPGGSDLLRVGGSVTVASTITSLLTSAIVLSAAAATTERLFVKLANTAGYTILGVESSTGGGLFTGSSANSAVFGTPFAKSVHLATNNTVRLTIDSSGSTIVGSDPGGGEVLRVGGSVRIGGLVQNLGLGVAPTGNCGIIMGGNLTTGTIQVGAQFRPIFNPGATITGRTVDIQVVTQAAGFTMADGAGIYVNTPSIGSGSGINNLYGIYIADQTGGALFSYALYTVGGRVHFGNLPTSTTGLVSGDIWRNGTAINIIP